MAGVDWDAAHKDRLAGMKYEDIATKYGVTLSAVKSRAARYWKNSGGEKSAPKSKKVAALEGEKPDKISKVAKYEGEKNDGENADSKTNTPHPQARFGNTNAEGNTGGSGGPLRNKHAVKTHEYETIFWTADIIDDKERALLEADYDKYIQQLILIDTLKVREKRILQDIKRLKTKDGGMVFESVTKNKTTTTTQYFKREDDGSESPGSFNTVTEEGSSHVAVPVLREVMLLEEALTRVQGRLQRAIEVWHKMEMDDEKRHIDRAKLSLLHQRITGQYDLDEMVDGDDLGLELAGRQGE